MLLTPRRTRTTVSIVAVAFVVASLAGCSSAAKSSDTTVRTAVAKKVVYLINGSLGDKSFYDSGQAGMAAIKAKYGVETRTIEDGFDAGKYAANLAAAINYADVIFTISYGFEDQLMAAADAHPDKIIVNLDTVVTNPAKTITSVDYTEEESAFLAGAVAIRFGGRSGAAGSSDRDKARGRLPGELADAARFVAGGSPKTSRAVSVAPASIWPSRTAATCLQL